jgi:hypothetical protein
MPYAEGASGINESKNVAPVCRKFEFNCIILKQGAGYVPVSFMGINCLIINVSLAGINNATCLI